MNYKINNSHNTYAFKPQLLQIKSYQVGFIQVNKGINAFCLANHMIHKKQEKWLYVGSLLTGNTLVSMKIWTQKAEV